jgi:HK97 family phage prohead protease
MLTLLIVVREKEKLRTDIYGDITMQYKEFNVKYDDSGNGSLEGYASTWIRQADSYGDVVKSGAFARTLKERWNGGKGIPLLWAHQMDNLKSFIGTAEAEEDEKGLHFLASFDGTEEAQRVRELYKDGRLSKFSFAFDVRDNGTVTLEDGTKANELRDLELFEISCVCVPANDDAGVVDVKAGRRNSAKDADAIRQAISLLQSVLDEEDSDDGEDKPEANEASEEPKASNPKKEDLLAYIKNMEG